MRGLRWAVLGFTLANAACDPSLVTAPEAIRFVAVAAGGAHTCALDSDGAAWCWGSNSSGQLGVSRRHTSVATPVAVRGGPFRAIFAGERHTCAQDADDRLLCWGSNESGQLGDGGFDDRDVPGIVRIDRPLPRLALGASHTCGTDRDGAVWCWGRNDRGQVGPGPTLVPLPLRREPTGPVGGIAAGGGHSCAIGAAGAFCWGANDHRQLGSATAADSPFPQRVGAGGLIHSIMLGRAHSCGLTSDQQVVCWGSNEKGQVGFPDRIDIGTAVPVPGLRGGVAFVGVGSGGDLSCAAGAGGSVWCWGAREDPRLGPIVTRPVAIAGLPVGALTGLAVGNAHACALVAEAIQCWGEGASGQLGDGRRLFSDVPVTVGSAPG